MKINRDSAPATITFRPNIKSVAVLSDWENTGYDRTILINTLIVKYGKKEIQELPRRLEEVGFAPKVMPLTLECHDRDQLEFLCASSSSVERLPDTQDVAGSIPASRTTPHNHSVIIRGNSGVQSDNEHAISPGHNNNNKVQSDSPPVGDERSNRVLQVGDHVQVLHRNGVHSVGADPSDSERSHHRAWDNVRHTSFNHAGCGDRSVDPRQAQQRAA